jgi:hypothetical protein
MIAAFVLAIGSAFVTKGATKPYALQFQQVGTSCVSASTACGTGSKACNVTVYSSRPNPNTCATLITQMP